MELSVSLVSGLVGAVISFGLSTIPKLKGWWEKQTDTTKRLGWLIGCLVVPFALMALVCFADLNLGVVMPSCDKDGWVQVVLIGGSTYLGGQGAYAVTKVRNGE